MGFWCFNLVPRISESWPRAPRPQVSPACCLYDIGTKIIYFQCFVTTDMFLFCKPIIFSGNCRIYRDLAFGSIKTRFKAILKKLDFSAQIDFFAAFWWNMSPKRLHVNLHLHLNYYFQVFFTKRNLAQYPHRSALQAPYFACAEIWWIAMSLAYQRASRPYKRLVFDDFTFFNLYISFQNYNFNSLTPSLLSPFGVC